MLPGLRIVCRRSGGVVVVGEVEVMVVYERGRGGGGGGGEGGGGGFGEVKLVDVG